MMATRTAVTIHRRFYTWFAVCAFLIVFAGFAHRRRPEYHKRIMILASCSLLLPAIGRIPLFGTVLFDAVGFWGLVAITEVPPVTCILYDSIKHRRLHPAFGWGGAMLVASFPTFLLVGASDSWLKFATWLLSR